MEVGGETVASEVAEESVRLGLPLEIARWLRGVADERFTAWADEVTPAELQERMNELMLGELRDGQVAEWTRGINEKTGGFSEPMRWFLLSAILRGALRDR